MVFNGVVSILPVWVFVAVVTTVAPVPCGYTISIVLLFTIIAAPDRDWERLNDDY